MEVERKAGETCFDGDGRAVKISDLTKTSFGGVWGSWNSNNEYFIYSSVTGKKVTSLDSLGAHYRTHVYLGSSRIADERNGSIVFNSTDPLTGSTRETDADGATFPGDEEETRVELAGLDTSMPLTEIQAPLPPNYNEGSSAGNAEGGCVLNGVRRNPSACKQALKSRGAVVDHNRSDPWTAQAYGVFRTRKPRYRFIDPTPPPDSPENPEGDDRTTIPTGSEAVFDGWDDDIIAISQSLSQSRPWIGPGLPSDLRERIKDVTTRKDCKPILDAMLDALREDEEPASYDFDVLFMRLTTVHLHQELRTAGVAQIRKGKRLIGILPSTSSSEKQRTSYYVSKTIAETVHHARLKGKYSDADLDNAARMVLPNLTPGQQKQVGQVEAGADDGALGHKLINTFCKYSEAEVN